MAGRKGRRTNKQTWEKEEGGREKRRKEADQNGSPVATAETKQHHCHLHRLFPSPGSSSLSVKKANTPLIRAKKEGSFPIGKDIIYPNDPRFSPSDHVRYTSRAQTEGFAFCCEKPSFASTPPTQFFLFFFFQKFRPLRWHLVAASDTDTQSGRGGYTLFDKTVFKAFGDRSEQLNVTLIYLPFLQITPTKTTDYCSKNGCIQILGRASKKEAIRCHEILIESQMLGIQTIQRHPQSIQTFQTREGQKVGLQGQARFRYLQS